MCTKCFHFCNRKKHNFPKKENIVLLPPKTKTEKDYFIWNHTDFVVYCLNTYCCLLCSRCLVSSHNALYFPLERERVVLRDQTTVAIETGPNAVPLTEWKSKLFVYRRLPQNTIPRNFMTKSKLRLCCTSNRPYPKIYYNLEYILNKRKG